MAAGPDLQAIAEPWLAFMAHCLIDGTIGFCVVMAVWLPLRRRAPAQLGYALFLLVLLKIAWPVPMPAPAWTAWLSAERLLSGALEPRAAAEPAAPIAAAALLARPAADAPAAAVPAAAGWAPWLLAAWVAVAGALLVRFARVQQRTQRVVRLARPAAPKELGVDPDELRHRARVRRPVRFLISDAVTTPAAGGLLSSYVLIPAGLLPRLRPRALSWVLLHELAHVRRGDLWVAAAQRLVGILFFFHPVVWLANRLVDEQRELACDEEALAASRVDPKECGAGFLTIVEWARDRDAGAAATLAMFAPKSVIRRRLMHILNHGRGSRAGRAFTISCILATALFVLPSARARAGTLPAASAGVLVQEPQDPEDPGLAELQRSLERLRRENEALQQKLEALAQKMRGGASAEPREHAAPRAAAGRLIEAAPGGASIYVLRSDGEKVELDSGAGGIYVLDQDDGTVVSRALTGRVLAEGVRTGGKDGKRKAARFYVVDGEGQAVQGEVEAELEVEAEAEGQDKAQGKGVRSHALRGIGLDPEGRPAAGSGISVRGLKGSARALLSDPSGTFEIEELPAGKARVIVVKPDGDQSVHEVVTEDGRAKIIVRGTGEGAEKPAKAGKKKARELQIY